MMDRVCSALPPAGETAEASIRHVRRGVLSLVQKADDGMEPPTPSTLQALRPRPRDVPETRLRRAGARDRGRVRAAPVTDPASRRSSSSPWRRSSTTRRRCRCSSSKWPPPRAPPPREAKGGGLRARRQGVECLRSTTPPPTSCCRLSDRSSPPTRTTPTTRRRRSLSTTTAPRRPLPPPPPRPRGHRHAVPRSTRRTPCVGRHARAPRPRGVRSSSAASAPCGGSTRADAGESVEVGVHKLLAFVATMVQAVARSRRRSRCLYPVSAPTRRARRATRRVCGAGVHRVRGGGPDSRQQVAAIVSHRHPLPHGAARRGGTRRWRRRRRSTRTRC